MVVASRFPVAFSVSLVAMPSVPPLSSANGAASRPLPIWSAVGRFSCLRERGQTILRWRCVWRPVWWNWVASTRRTRCAAIARGTRKATSVAPAAALTSGERVAGTFSENGRAARRSARSAVGGQWLHYAAGSGADVLPPRCRRSHAVVWRKFAAYPRRTGVHRVLSTAGVHDLCGVVRSEQGRDPFRS